MKAAQYNSYGGAEVIEINENAPEPILKDKQILVENKAASINPIDYKVRGGSMKDKVPFTFPVTIGGDFSGVVKEVAPGVTEFKVGDEVYGQAIILNGGSGSFAEIVAANVSHSGLKPKQVDFIQASALPLAGSSAIQAIEEHINLKNGQKILIHGGAGGIGSLAIQVAGAIGAEIATTVSSKDKDFVTELGAATVIDYESQKFEEMLKDYDAVFDTVGGETRDKSFQVLKKGGILVSMVGKPSEELAQKYGVTVIGQGTHTTTEKLNRLKELVDSGKIKPQVDKEFPLEESQEAFKYQEEVHPRGKVVVTIN